MLELEWRARPPCKILSRPGDHRGEGHQQALQSEPLGILSEAARQKLQQRFYGPQAAKLRPTAAPSVHCSEPLRLQPMSIHRPDRIRVEGAHRVYVPRLSEMLSQLRQPRSCEGSHLRPT